MSVNTEPHVSVPDLIDPVVGFRGWSYTEPMKRTVIQSYVKKGRTIPAVYDHGGRKEFQPFHEPNAFITLPNGNVMKDYKAITEAFEKWRNSIYFNEDGTKYKRLITPEKIIPDEVVPERIVEATPGLLHSRQGFRWQKDQNTAWCGVYMGQHQAPDEKCQCGLYCYYESMATTNPTSGHQAFGIVTCSGKIQAHATGMRCEFMKIEHLFGGPNLKPLAEEWGIPWTDSTKFKDNESLRKHMMKISVEYGSPLPKDMRADPDLAAELANTAKQYKQYIGGGYGPTNASWAYHHQKARELERQRKEKREKEWKRSLAEINKKAEDRVKYDPFRDPYGTGNGGYYPSSSYGHYLPKYYDPLTQTIVSANGKKYSKLSVQLMSPEERKSLGLGDNLPF